MNDYQQFEMLLKDREDFLTPDEINNFRKVAEDDPKKAADLLCDRKAFEFAKRILFPI